MCVDGISYRGKLTVATPLKDVFCSSHKPFAVNNSSGKDWVAQPLPHPWWIIDKYSFTQIITDDASSWVWQPCHAQEILCFTVLSLILQHLHSSHLLFCKFHEASQLRVGVDDINIPFMTELSVVTYFILWSTVSLCSHWNPLKEKDSWTMVK